MTMTKKTNIKNMVNHLLHKEKRNDKNVLVKIGSEWVICRAN